MSHAGDGLGHACSSSPPETPRGCQTKAWRRLGVLLVSPRLAQLCSNVACSLKFQTGSGRWPLLCLCCAPAVLLQVLAALDRAKQVASEVKEVLGSAADAAADAARSAAEQASQRASEVAEELTARPDLARDSGPDTATGAATLQVSPAR